jgi:hypothetical protein|tara:strand:- start:201 stop:485 length:285 start_codon:yes stop_codon:yes gene_type:complete
MTPKQKQVAVDTMLKSKGWAVIQEEMEKSILQAAFQLCDGPAMPIDEVHFRRGSMWAARKFTDLPTVVSQILNNNILMDAANRGELKQDATASL